MGSDSRLLLQNEHGDKSSFDAARWETSEFHHAATLNSKTHMTGLMWSLMAGYKQAVRAVTSLTGDSCVTGGLLLLVSPIPKHMNHIKRQFNPLLQVPHYAEEQLAQ